MSRKIKIVDGLLSRLNKPVWKSCSCHTFTAIWIKNSWGGVSLAVSPEGPSSTQEGDCVSARSSLLLTCLLLE